MALSARERRNIAHWTVTHLTRQIPQLVWDNDLSQKEREEFCAELDDRLNAFLDESFPEPPKPLEVGETVTVTGWNITGTLLGTDDAGQASVKADTGRLYLLRLSDLERAQ